MLFCLGLIAILLYDTVFASATCSRTFERAPGQIDAISQRYLELGHRRCEFVLRAPSQDFTIVLNLTVIYGFEAAASSSSSSPPPPPSPTPPPSAASASSAAAAAASASAATITPCLPSLEIAELQSDGGVVGMRCICRSSAAPLVLLSSTSVIRLTYVWAPTPSPPSGFSLAFDFHHKYSDNSGPCEFTCSDRGCLSSWSLVCNGVADCSDESDEQDCPLPLPSSGSPRNNNNNHNNNYNSNNINGVNDGTGADDVSSIQIIIIVIAIALTLGILTCVVSHYKMGARSWSERRDRQPPQQGHHHHHHGDLNASTVLYLPTSSQERIQREMATLQERQIRNKSVQQDMKMDLPPSIALPDGEEGPHNNLLHLHLRDPDQESEIKRECIRPPPNRTVYERDSPPPYRSRSVGVLHPEPDGTPPPRGWNGTPLVMRCHSMSTNNNATRNGNHSSSSSSSSVSSHSPSLPHQHHHHHHHHLNPSPLPTNSVLTPAGGARQLSACPPEGEPPPGYSEVIARPDIYSSLHHPSSGV